MKRDDRPFLVGRRTRKGTTVVLLQQRPSEPILPGPWTVRAVVKPAS